MKKVIFFLLLLVTTDSFARKVFLTIHNKTDFELIFFQDINSGYFFSSSFHSQGGLSDGSFERDGDPNVKVLTGDEFLPGRTIKYHTDNSDFATGMVGFLKFYAVNNDKSKYYLQFNFNNPCFGSNEFSTVADHPFEIHYLSGGSGNEAAVEYEITGGPSAVPPPPPIPLPYFGSRSISGIIEWNENKCGRPTIANITKAITVKATVPAVFRQRADGGGSYIYKNKRGYYEGVQNSGNVEIDLPKYQLMPSKSLSNGNTQAQNGDFITYLTYKVYNLPNEIPVNVKVEVASEWKPGPGSPPKPDKQSEKYFGYVWEKRNTGKGIDYEVSGAWMYPDANGNTTTGDGQANRLMDKAKNKPSFENEDIVFGHDGLNNQTNKFDNNTINTVPVITTNNNPANNGNIKQAPVNNNQQKTTQPINNQLKTTTPSQQKTNVQQKVQIKN